MTSRAAFLAALAFAGLLAACGSKTPPGACPSGLIPTDASKITRFRDGTGRDLTDVIVEGNVQDILVQCKYSKKEVVVDLQIAITADRGPADRSRVAEFPYFVAVQNPDGEISTKEQFKVRFDFTDNRTHLGVVLNEAEPHIPLADVAKADAYRIIVGFQLTPDELAWNRSQNSKQP